MKGRGRSKKSHNLACAGSILNIIIQNRTGKDLDRSFGPPLPLRQDPSAFLDLNCSCQIYVQLQLKKPPGTDMPFTPALSTLTDTFFFSYSAYVSLTATHTLFSEDGDKRLLSSFQQLLRS